MKVVVLLLVIVCVGQERERICDMCGLNGQNINS